MTQIFGAYFGHFSREIIRQFTPNWFTVTMGLASWRLR
jgi:hypothetical protein